MQESLGDRALSRGEIKDWTVLYCQEKGSHWTRKRRMNNWICIVCGWTYSESEGLPDEGIPPGTKLEDIPSDWTCPDCGVGIDEFELIAI